MNATILTSRDIAILDFESRFPMHSARKEEEIVTVLDLSAVRYYQILGRLLDSPAALAHDPLLVRRLRRLRDADRARRTPQRAPVRAAIA
ncbi:DUF3263 domain-containing protein [Microbacterium sp. GXS0129]|uniref:DUF3263 domain-containing protein n=1 Tax=Microbacterium sp. GXS0129 TaxID=3377836 RepID=UPI00383AC632